MIEIIDKRNGDIADCLAGELDTGTCFTCDNVGGIPCDETRVFVVTTNSLVELGKGFAFSYTLFMGKPWRSAVIQGFREADIELILKPAYLKIIKSCESGGEQK